MKKEQLVRRKEDLVSQVGLNRECFFFEAMVRWFVA